MYFPSKSLFEKVLIDYNLVAEKRQELDTDVCFKSNDVNYCYDGIRETIKQYSWIGVKKMLSAKQNRLVKAKTLSPWLNTNLFLKIQKLNKFTKILKLCILLLLSEEPAPPAHSTGWEHPLGSCRSQG